MAVFKNNPFPGVDYSQYMNWERVTTPDGGTYYVVPGHPDYVMDITASNATGRKVFRKNPSQAIADQQKAQEEHDKQVKQQNFNQSPTGQLLPVVAGTGGLVAANYFLNGGGSAAATTANAVANAAANGAVGAGATGAAGVATPSVVSATTVPGSTAPGMLTGAGTYVTKPLETLGGASIADVAGAAAIAKGGYDALDAWQHGGKGIRGSGAEIGAGVGTLILPGIGTAIGAVGGNLLGYGLQKFMPGIFHKTTRQEAMEHTDSLRKTAPDDPVWQNYVKTMRQQYDAAPPDPSKPFHGQYASWDEYKTAGLDAGDLTGVLGNLKTYGPDWAKLSLDQQKAIVQANINDGLYDSKKGEVIINNEQKALDNKTKVLGGVVAPTNQKPSTPTPVVVPATKPIVQPVNGNPVLLAPGPVAPLQPGQNPDPGFTLGAAAAQGAMQRRPLDRVGRG